MSKRMPVSLNTMVNLYVDPLMVQLQRIFTTYYLLKNQCSTEFGIKISQAGSYVLHQRSDGTISGAAQENTYLRAQLAVDTCCALVVVFIT